MSEDFIRSDPLVSISFQHCLQELDTLLSLFSLSSVIFLQTHLGNNSQIQYQSSHAHNNEKTINHRDNESYFTITFWIIQRLEFVAVAVDSLKVFTTIFHKCLQEGSKCLYECASKSI